MTSPALIDGRAADAHPWDAEGCKPLSDDVSDTTELPVLAWMRLTERHHGGTAYCNSAKLCEVCGKAYGELDAHNHAALNHSEATAATEDAEGNIEYWYCAGCGKYYADAAASREITKAATVTEKLSNETKSPQTGDAGSRMLWFALLFIGGGAGTALTVKRKKFASIWR